MTNGEKYLKDGVDVHELAKNLGFYLENAIDFDWQEGIISYFKQNTKPTLTEDERIILRNVKNFTTIIRNIEGNIQVENEDGSFACLCAFNHLFQFIKVGEKHEIKELLQDD